MEATVASTADGFDFDFGKLLAMSILFPVAFASFFLKNDGFVALHEGIQYDGTNAGASHDRRADFEGLIGPDHVYLVEGHFVAFCGF